MLPHYTTIRDSDVEKQPLVNDYQRDQSCECGRQQQRNRRSRPSKSTVAIFVLLVFLFVGYGRNICQQKHDHSHLVQPVDHQQQQQSVDTFSSVSSNLRYCPRDHPLDVHWDGKSVYEFGQEITSLSVEHKHNKGRLSTMAGDVVVVENKKLEKSKVTFNIKLTNDRAQNAIHIDESSSKHGLALTVITDGHQLINDCVKIDVLIELPSSAVLDGLTTKFINNDVTIKDSLKLTKFLEASTVSGDLTIKKPVTSPNITLNVVSGDINAAFDVDQINLSAASVSGDVDIVFTGISHDSNISVSTVSGNMDLKVPSDFESSFAMGVVTGSVDLNAKNTEKLHYHRSGGIIGHKINGYYGNDESPSSKIKVNAVSGNAKLSYR